MAKRTQRFAIHFLGDSIVAAEPPSGIGTVLSSRRTADRARFIAAHTSQQQPLQQFPAVTAVEEQLAAQQDKLQPGTAGILPAKTSDDETP